MIEFLGKLVSELVVILLIYVFFYVCVVINNAIFFSRDDIYHHAARNAGIATICLLVFLAWHHSTNS